jgi:hypothetical protein
MRPAAGAILVIVVPVALVAASVVTVPLVLWP